jgi:hypothetical protein
MSRLRRLASSLRAGFLRASTPTWISETTLLGISVPSPRSFR